MDIKRLAIGVAIAAVIATPFILFNQNTSAQASDYMDYGTIPSIIDSDYAYSQIYYKSNTTRIVKSDGGDNSLLGDFTGKRFYIQPGKTFVMLISNSSATDAAGNPVDVIWKINNVKYWSTIKNADGTDATNSDGTPINQFFDIADRSNTCGTTKTIPDEQDIQSCVTENARTLAAGDPIMFWLDSSFASADFTVQYIKKGTFNDSTLSGTPAGISKLTYVAYDFDVPNHEARTGYDYLNGDEGVRVTPASASKTTYYFNKSNKTESMPEIYEAENGLAVRNLGNNGYSSSFNGIHWSTSHFATVKDMANSSYTFTYSATGAGATYFFGSPVPYDTPAPAKYIDEINKTENRATSETKYNYIITQRIPENFSTENDILTFSSLFSTYSNIKSNRKYTEFSISDTLNANLLVPERNEIKVYQGDTDITSKFQITTEGQKVTASITNLNDSTIYGATIRLIIPVTTKNIVATKVINNEAVNSYTNTSNTPGRKTSNTTSTNIYHKLTVRHIDKETGKEISDTVVKEYNHGDEYVSDMASDLPTGYQLISTPDNAKGIMNNNVTVIYYYNIPKNPSTLDHDLVPFAIVLGSTAVVAYGLFRIVAKRR